jgi:methylenetetrahydrofolate reductase (NADPH)
MSAGHVLDTRSPPEETLAQLTRELLVSGSLEMGLHQGAEVEAIAALLPAGARVYVNHPPRHSLAQMLGGLKALREAGLDPVAHIAARRVASRDELRSFLERASGEAGLARVLVLGGDVPQPLGPYASGLELLREDVLRGYGIREVGLPGYPEGHPKIPRMALQQALFDKLAVLAAQGLAAYVVTQFSFAPVRVVEYCAELARRHSATPVYVGLAGPTEARTLLRFAQICGVSASLRALRAQGMGAIRLVTHTDPGQQLAAVARYCLGRTSCNVVGAHFFSFGGVANTVAWMHRRITALATPGAITASDWETR